MMKCMELGAMPVIIHNDEQQKYWQLHVDRKGDEFVLGIVCNTATMRWEWADGSQIDYRPPQHDPNLERNCITDASWRQQLNGYWIMKAGHIDDGYTDIFCIKNLMQPIPSAEGCDSFADDSTDGVCYQIGGIAMSWPDAQKICRGVGANVASIHTVSENSFVRRLAVSKGAVNGVFLGATTVGKGNDFGWIDGTAWDYENFYPGFPVAGAGDCIAMDTSSTTGQWQNFDCSSTSLPVACIREQKPVVEPMCAGPWNEGDIIASPGFPFTSSTPCDFFLTVKAGNRVEMEIILLEANTCCDSLVIYNGNLSGNVIANLTGEKMNATYTSSSNSMKVSWQPMGGVNVRGVMKFPSLIHQFLLLLFSSLPEISSQLSITRDAPSPSLLMCIRILHVAQYDPLDALLPTAREECNRDDAHLPIIRSDEENEMINHIANSMDELKERDMNLVLDLNCKNSTSRLEWADGSSLSYLPDSRLEVDFDCVHAKRTLFSKPASAVDGRTRKSLASPL
ncbi:hypothetical protein PRIPAC_85943 [Pristionchus pacificus]|nr:hypothetical protein PRIPAC_85943 [Pristionchus pacificus]